VNVKVNVNEILGFGTLEDPRNYAYDQVLERLNEFFPVPEYVNKVVPRTDLAELGLITGEGLDKMLMGSGGFQPITKSYPSQDISK
jgi:hypothetical protein